MKTIGQILKDARVEKKYSLGHLEGITKIKKGFIAFIESENWGQLPSFPTVLGFVKSLAGALEINEKTAVAILKRDYPPKKLAVNPKPDAVQKFLWSPKLTFIFGVTLFILLIFGYLGFQYFKFISPPTLTIESPKEGQIVSDGSVQVFGTTDSDAKITINNQPVLVNDEGKFSATISVTPVVREVDIIAISRSGKETTVKRSIQVKNY